MPIKFDAEDKPLGDIFTGQEKYKIPRYQRPYSWTTDEVSELWSDLREEDSTFLGSFVFNYEKYNEDKFVEVIDGQQRLISLMILLAVLRDLYKSLGDKDGADLTQSLIAHKHPVSRVEDFRLRCGDSLNVFFTENIQKKDSKILDSTPKRKEFKAVKANYEFLKNKISDELKLISEKSKQITYLDNLKQKIFDFKIIWIKVENDDDAYSIFETVNARGADLTAADLLKNHIFSKIPPSEAGIDIAKDTWSTIEDNVESAKGPLNVSKFIRYYWLSKYSFVQEKKLYREIKKTITDTQALLDDILKASEYYYKIASSSVGINDWQEDFEDKKTAQKIVETLNGLRTMGITQCYSLLFCLLLNKDKIGFDFSYIFKTIENYHFAYSAVSKLSGNVVERKYFNVAREIQDALINSSPKKRTQNIQNALKRFEDNLEYPSKSLFVEKFMDIEYKNYPLVIYILSNIEKAKGLTEEQVVNFTKVNIEHILPQDPKEWGLAKKEIKDYVNKLGNLTLISKKINGTIGNKILKEKVDLFKDSTLNSNVELVAKFKSLKYKWGEKEIDERQKELAEFAYDIVWKFE
ncbi:MAG: DUF262 domain-containing HNH endonuclease family protein [Candidatus Staskawiczbacteria bacterium]|nr:DUF262 domain-containing HNH endonuclease family protein [Candidatus Staskawiczbacteria bacterium]